MSDIKELDAATQRVAAHTYRSLPPSDWEQVIVRTRIPPHGKASSSQMTVRMDDGKIDEGVEAVREEERRLIDATYEHWRLTQDLGQPRWYMMTVTVQRSGKYTVDFEYRDHYEEGDISKPLPPVKFD